MKLLLILSLLLSLTSIALPLRAEEQICEIERQPILRNSKKREKRAEGYLDIQFDLWMPTNCKQGDMLTLFEYAGAPPYATKSINRWFASNCEIGTIQFEPSKAWICVFRGYGNELKVREATP